MEFVLKTNALCKTYRSFHALNGVTMNVPKGSIYGFVGKNGAGKTTLIRLICGLHYPTSGDYTLYGTKNSDGTIARTRRRMSAVVETPSFYGDMNAVDNIKMQYTILGLSSYDDTDDLLKLARLNDTGKKKAKHFSLGMKQRLGIAMALCGNPDFLILDEPTNGLDPQGIVEIRELILRLNQERKITVLISSHILDELSKLATHYGFIDKGKIIKEMSSDELDSACQKCVRLSVTDTTVLSGVLDDMRLEYKVIDNAECDIYAKPNITELALALAKENCEILSVQERNQSLESFFLSLVGDEER
jgi:ABC-2 type transport system ATP-binding protein